MKNFVSIDSASKQAVASIECIDKLTRYGIERAWYTSGQQLIKATSADILRKPKGGRTYIRRDRAGRRRRHVASAPAETHANRTGAVRRSLGFSVNTTQLEFGYGVQSSNPAPDYAEFLENGTSKMAPRPSLLNNIRGQRRNIVNNFEYEIPKSINKGRG